MWFAFSRCRPNMFSEREDRKEIRVGERRGGGRREARKRGSDGEE